MSKYLDPKADLTFKKVFAEHKNLLISLLNALLPLEEDQLIEYIEYWPAEKIPRRSEIEKDSIVDVCCRDKRGREFLVEMQMAWSEEFRKRVLFNSAKAYVAQSVSGQDYNNLQPVYSLNFINSNMKLDVDGYYHHYRLVHEKNTNEIIDGLQLVFIELPKFRPETISEKKMQVLWLRYLTEINSQISEAPAELLENTEINQALSILETSSYTEEQMRTYDRFWDNISIYRTLEGARNRESQMRIIAEKKCDKAEQERDKAEQERDKAEQERDEAKAQVESMINFLKLQGMSDSKIAEIINSKEKNTTESEETVK